MTAYPEDEARDKWCPFSRIPTTIPAPDQTCPAATGNRATTMDDECNCIASDCMAWRWLAEPKPQGERRGYCGQAGYPTVAT